MPARFLGFALILLPNMAWANANLPWFGSAAVGAIQIDDVTGSLSPVDAKSQLKIKTSSACTIQTCPNPRNFGKERPANSALPQ